MSRENMQQELGASLRALENQVGQIGNSLNSRPQGALLSDTEKSITQEKEQCNAITLRSGTQLDDVVQDTTTEWHNFRLNHGKNSKSTEKHNAPEKGKQKNITAESDHDVQFKRFLDVLKQLHINIPLVEALEQMPNYVKFMKDILSKKYRLGEFETVALIEGCTTMLMNKLPLRLKDPRSFTIPCSTGNHYIGKTLCDLGASVNLMPMSIFRKLGIGKARLITVTLQLADRSYAH
ncbi:uncharacterized protein LOC128041752 [Gossypium raimondii]|uniref:uncharacterized protein LOC128041752 n=1 Tax=Gossypium raimondii TaxID=29730 RepID=UPI00227A66F8|nr:uncharacterized protein LOC128041752 [Gossypium raimondii]